MSIPSKLIEDLRAIDELEVFDDVMTRQVYSQDASIFRVLPKVVTWPRNVQHVQEIVKVCQKHKTPICPRGAATSVTGAPLGSGVIIDTSRWMNQILAIDHKQFIADVQPGVIQDQLNEALAPFHLRLGPDTSTGNRATIGGMIANNSAGAHSLVYGMMDSHVIELDVVLSDGSLVTLKTNHTKAQIHDPAITDNLHRILDTCWQLQGHEGLKALPNVCRSSAGYNIKALANSVDSINLCHAFCGSEGTLGVIVRARLRVCEKPKFTGILLLGYRQLREAFEEAGRLAELSPYALEVIDDQILGAARISPEPQLRQLPWLWGEEKAFLGFEVLGQTSAEVLSKLQSLESHTKIACRQLHLLNPSEQEGFWKVRKSGVGLLLSRRSQSKAIAFIEDLTVPPERAVEFLDGLYKIFEKEGCQAGIYGHIAAGCLHVRPYINLQESDDEERMWRISESTAELIKNLGGVLTGGHGDGLVRSWLSQKFFEPSTLQAFRLFRQAFDPYELMNPGKILDAERPKEALKVHPHLHEASISSNLDFSHDGGLAQAARRCNGNGQCRKHQGAMCPSFQATGDERHSTRGRAVALQGILDGHIEKNYWHSHELYEIFDLCLECKACVRECPSSVDMAKFKAEFLHSYHQQHGMSMRSWLFSHFGKLSAIASILPHAIKRSINDGFLSHLLRPVLQRMGIASSRKLPKIALETLDKLYRNRYSMDEATVVLYSDTHCSFYQPQVALSTLALLEKMGERPHLAPFSCCGRPAFSKGALNLAKEQSLSTLKLLEPAYCRSLPIIVLEPSCRSLLTHDLPGLVPGDRSLKLASCIRSLEQYLIDCKPYFLQNIGKGITWHMHLHCHERSLEGEHPIKSLAQFLGIDLHLLPAGCCGMAGSFGMEAEHEEISKKIANLHLLPYIEQLHSSAILIANGVSCRAQLVHLANRQPLSLAEAINRLPSHS